MRTPRSSSRASRSQVVIVASENDFLRYSEELSIGAIGVGSLFEALGEVTTASATAPISTVVVSLDAAPNDSKHIVNALHRVDPALRLIAVAQSKKQISDSGIAIKDFDAVMVEPVNSNSLQRALNDEIEPFDMPAEPTAREEALLDAPPLQTTSQIDSPIVKPQVAEQVPSELTSADLLGDINKKRNDIQTISTESLGDIDLVDAIQNESSGVLATALALMNQQTKWADVRLEDQCADDGRASVEIKLNNESFGWLYSNQADAKSLGPWADWLARWLSLDKRYRDFRMLSFRDDLTGAWNRRFFERFMEDILKEAAAKRRAVSLMVFDIDNFKQYNDKFGHASGDEILRETVRLLKSMIRKGDRVCRLGGDEFAVIFADLSGQREAGSSPPDTVEQIANRFQHQICKMNYPKLGIDAPGTLSISGGLATFPWDGSTVAVLLDHADKLALMSKKKGKNVLTFGPGAKQICNLMDDDN